MGGINQSSVRVMALNNKKKFGGSPYQVFDLLIRYFHSSLYYVKTPFSFSNLLSSGNLRMRSLDLKFFEKMFKKKNFLNFKSVLDHFIKENAV